MKNIRTKKTLQMDQFQKELKKLDPSKYTQVIFLIAFLTVFILSIFTYEYF